MSFNFNPIHAYLDKIDIDDVMRRLPFPNKKKSNGKWWVTCLNPHHKIDQSGTSLPSVFNTAKAKKEAHKGKFFCYSCKNFLSLEEVVRKLTTATTDKEVRTFLGIEDNVDINVQYRQLFTARPKPPNFKDDLFDGNYIKAMGSFLTTEYDNEEFKKRGFTKEFIDHFLIQVSSHPYWDDRYMFPVFSYVEELKEYRCFGWEARRLVKDIEPKTLQPVGSKLSRVLLNSYNLDYTKELILVEGFPDVARIWSSITKNVSCLWTCRIYSDGLITQLNTLNKFKEITILGDNDESGRALEQDALKKIDKKVVLNRARIGTDLDGRDPSDCNVAELKEILYKKERLR